ncbi:putative transport protein [Tindallia magadiensis]|uniref:Putative transport protein n=1 Tax=Tindallia magadiensis TaxID=69895 RepID=A0A1I3D754_9FIRM|nr:putative transport protein [Tindallia magadiensis]
MNVTEIAANPFLLIGICVLAGHLMGQIEVKEVKLGSSAVLFAGILISYPLISYLKTAAVPLVPENGQLIPASLFHLSLMIFIASVGLMAAKHIRLVIRQYGYQFLLLALAITTAGASASYFFMNFLYPTLRTAILGTYVGALTSSPGLATALEITGAGGGGEQSMVGLGYSIAYIPGIMAAVIFVQLIYRNHKRSRKNDINQERTEVKRSKEKIEITEKGQGAEGCFCMASFSFVCVTGIILGNISFYLGSFLGTFSLGTTGGVLISALLLGDRKKLGPFLFLMDDNKLGVLRDTSLNLFLAIVGLNYGYQALHMLQEVGATLLWVGTMIAVVSILVGYLVGKHLLKLPTVYLVGGICGGMTSTPGLAASIDAFESDEVTVGYGAAYPFALLLMILYTNILYR